MNFKEWLMHFKNVNLPIGDLAKEIERDENFPNTSDKEIILEHLESHNAMDGVINTFEYVYAFYKEDKKL